MLNLPIKFTWCDVKVTEYDSFIHGACNLYSYTGTSILRLKPAEVRIIWQTRPEKMDPTVGVSENDRNIRNTFSPWLYFFCFHRQIDPIWWVCIKWTLNWQKNNSKPDKKLNLPKLCFFFQKKCVLPFSSKKKSVQFFLWMKLLRGWLQLDES